MDIRFIFLNLGCFVISWGRTRFDKSGILLTRCLNDKSVLIGKSVKTTVSRDENPEFIEGN
jgi:hypothetical protein